MQETDNHTSKTVVFDDWNEFFDEVIYRKGTFYDRINNGFIYRGDSGEFDLLPKSLRPTEFENILKLSTKYFTFDETQLNLINIEKSILVNFFYNCDDNSLYIPKIERLKLYFQKLKNTKGISNTYDKVWIPKYMFELAGLAQHYGLPTRLLDWSRDFNTALYFASTGEPNGEYIVIWALNLLHFWNVKENTPKCDRTSELIFIDPEYYRNPNLGSQKGILSLWQIDVKEDYYQKIDRTPLDQLIETRYKDDDDLDEPLLYKFMIPNTYVNNIYAHLRKNGYSAGRLFPGYEGVVKTIIEDKKFDF